MCKAQATRHQLRLSLSLLALLGQLASSSSGAAAAPTAESHHLSLAQILVPVLGGGGGQTEGELAGLSANNRGGPVHRAARFGERTHGRRADSGRTWSQPDPRKSYSLPLNLVELAKGRRHLVGAHKLRAESFKRSSGQAAATVARPADKNEHFQLKPMSLADEQPSGQVDNELGQHLAAEQPDDVEPRKRQARQQQQHQPGMAIAVIRYVPVLMPLPQASPAGDQLLAAPRQPARLLRYQPEQPEGPVALAWASEPSALDYQPAEQAQLQPVASSQPPVYLASQPAAPNSARALSSYAARLMSMLRPSSLLSSIQGGPQAAHYGPAAQIYLLAPLGAPATRPAASSGSTPAPVSPSSARPADLLLNQASRHSSIRSAGRPAGAVPQHNGLICVHSFGLPLAAGAQSLEPPPSAATTTVAPQSDTKLQQQQQQQQEELGFEFAPTTGRPVKESPVRLAKQRHKLTNKYVAAAAEEPAGVQQRLLGSLASDESRARSVSMNRTMIPFTIRDKIEPARRPPSSSSSSSNPTVQYDEPADSEPQVGEPQVQELQERQPGGRRSKTSFVQAKGGRQKKRPPIDYKNEPSGRDAAGYSLPLLLASSSRAREQVRSGEQINAAASSEVTTSSTVDGKPVSLASGRLVLVSSSSMGAEPNRSSTPASQRAPDSRTVELVVESTAPEPASSTTTTSSTTSTSTTSPPETQTNSNHSPVVNENSFSFDRQLSSLDSSMDEFSRISESLQTRAMDLIDLQNSRSTFELPGQLESLSMLVGAGGRPLVSGRGRQRRARQLSPARSRSQPNKH